MLVDDDNEPSSEGHVTCEAFERLDICVYSSIVSNGGMIDGASSLETNELGCVVQGVRPL